MKVHRKGPRGGTADASVLGADIGTIDISRHSAIIRGNPSYSPKIANNSPRQNAAVRDISRSTGAPQALPDDPGLSFVNAAWPELTEDVRQAVIELVKAAAVPVQ